MWSFNTIFLIKIKTPITIKNKSILDLLIENAFKLSFTYNFLFHIIKIINLLFQYLPIVNL